MLVTTECLQVKWQSANYNTAAWGEGSFCSLTDTQNCEPGSVPGSTASSIAGLMKSPSETESVSLIWIRKAISIKSLGHFPDIHMLSRDQQTIYVTFRCSIVLAPLPIDIPLSDVQRVAAWSFQDSILLSNCLTLRYCETKFLWMPAIVTLLCFHHLIWGGVKSLFFTQKVHKTLSVGHPGIVQLPRSQRSSISAKKRKAGDNCRAFGQ